jgi:hypothetical protein
MRNDKNESQVKNERKRDMRGAKEVSGINRLIEITRGMRVKGMRGM